MKFAHRHEFYKLMMMVLTQDESLVNKVFHPFDSFKECLTTGKSSSASDSEFLSCITSFLNPNTLMPNLTSIFKRLLL